jgi:serine/threonine-protein kinase
MVMAVLLATTLGLSSCWLGPFVLAPVSISTIGILFASRSRRAERPWLLLIWGLAVLLPFAVELLHLVPPAFTFRDGDLILHARALNLPPGLTLAGLAYTSLTFMALPMLLVGELRDRQRAGDRRQFVQAWHLRQLFPVAGKGGAPGGATP